MKRMNARSGYLRLMVFAVTISLLASQTMFAFSLTTGAVAAGEITVTGKADAGEKPFVLVNGDRAFSGRTFFSNGTISTPDTSSASINLGKVGRIELSPGSTLNLSFNEASISGSLTAGKIHVANADGVAVKIVTPDDTVTNEENRASSFSLNVAPGASLVAAESGSVRYNNGASVATKDDDDDDDDDGSIWIPIVVIGGAVGAVILFTVMNDDDELVSPVR